MLMNPVVRKFALTAHVSSSVGWLGAVAAFLALAVVGLRSPVPQTAHAAYLSMEMTARYVIVPLSIAALTTGLVQALGTRWGVFRHYWVLAKLLITIVATIVLLLHLQPIGRLASAAADATLHVAELQRFRVQLVANAVAAVIALMAATALAVFKPRGMTAYGVRRRAEERSADAARGGVVGAGLAAGPMRPRWVRLATVVVAIVIALFLLSHVLGRAHGGH